MIQSTQMLIATIGAFGAAAVAAVSLCWPRTIPGAEETAAPAVAPAAHVPCHSLVCAHMSTPHDLTPVGGLACRECGTVRTEVPRA